MWLYHFLHGIVGNIASRIPGSKTRSGLRLVPRAIRSVHLENHCYAIENPPAFLHCAVYEGGGGRIDGYMISSGRAMNMLGPCLAQSEQEAAVLILRELDLYRGRTPVFLIPVDCHNLVRWTYDLGARDCELHSCQVNVGDYSRSVASACLHTFQKRAETLAKKTRESPRG